MIEDRVYLEFQLQSLKNLKDNILHNKAIYMAECDARVTEITNQIDSIEKHFSNCIQKDI